MKSEDEAENKGKPSGFLKIKLLKAFVIHLFYDIMNKNKFQHTKIGMKGS